MTAFFDIFKFPGQGMKLEAVTVKGAGAARQHIGTAPVIDYIIQLPPARTDKSVTGASYSLI
eukprot:904935-Amphidinium_carterae.2